MSKKKSTPLTEGSLLRNNKDIKVSAILKLQIPAEAPPAPFYKKTWSQRKVSLALEKIIDETLTEYENPIDHEVTQLANKIARIFEDLFNTFPALSNNMDFQELFIKELEKRYRKIFKL